MFSLPNSELLHPVQSDEFLPPISRWETLSGLFLVGTVGAAITLVSIVKYNVTVKAPATVRPAGELQIVQAAAEGTIKSIKVKENQVVRTGDALATIDDSQLQIRKRQLQRNIQQNQLQLAQINAQINALDSQILANSSLMHRTIALAQADLERNQQELQQVEAELNKSVIRASTNGTILNLELRNPGQVVRTGEFIAQIVPSDTPLVLRAQVSARDIAKVQKRQTVQMRVSACPYPDYGTLKGTVSAISPDAITPQDTSTGVVAPLATTTQSRSVAAANAFYEVTIQLESLSLGGSARSCSIQLGMEGTADIISREETVLTFILRKARLLTDL